MTSPTVQPSVRNAPTGEPIHNQILLCIPDEEFQQIVPNLEFLELPHHLNLYEPGTPIEWVFFPDAGMISLVISTSEGKTVEVGEVGKEGFAGIPASVGMTTSHVGEVVQIAGRGNRMKATDLQTVLKCTPKLQDVLHRYTVVLGMQVAQTAACNRLHNINQRLARWLLVTRDRVAADTFHITQDFLSMMLGTDRPSVTLAAGALQKRGAIDYGRGVVQILDVPALKESACECHEVARKFHFEMRYIDDAPCGPAGKHQ